MNAVFDRAGRLPLYRRLWGVRTPRALEEAPYLTAWWWRQIVHPDPGRAPAVHPALWCLSAIPGDDPIWVPFGHDDILADAARAQITFRNAGIAAGDLVLSIAPSGPWVANATPYLIAATDSLTGRRPLGAEVLPLSVLTVAFKPDLTVFPFGRRPSVVVAAAADLATMVSLAASAGAQPLQCRLALMYGPAVERTRVPRVAETIVDLLHLPGMLAPVGGRPGLPGVWLSEPAVTAELIPDDEWARAIAHPGVQPAAVPLAQALGRAGELVVTIPGSVLPLVRFRTQERVRVMEVDAADGVRIERIPAAHAGIGEDTAWIPSMATVR